MGVKKTTRSLPDYKNIYLKPNQIWRPELADDRVHRPQRSGVGNSYLNKAYESRHPALVLIRIDPLFDRLGSEDRLKQFIRSVAPILDTRGALPVDRANQEAQRATVQQTPLVPLSLGD